MKNFKRKMKKGIRGGLTVWVMMLFGMIVVMYLFGYTSAYAEYTSRQIVNDETGALGDEGNASGNLTRPDTISQSGNIGTWMIEGIKSIFINRDDSTNWLAVIGTAIATIATFALAKFAGGQYAFAFIIPIVLFVIFANIFIFPIGEVATSGTPLTLKDNMTFQILIVVFFNLFLFLSIIEFVRGQPM